jgi:hypothetical protein
LVKKNAAAVHNLERKKRIFFWVAPLGAVSRQTDTGQKIGPDNVLHPTQTDQIKRDLDSKYVGQLKIPLPIASKELYPDSR